MFNTFNLLLDGLQPKRKTLKQHFFLLLIDQIAICRVEHLLLLQLLGLTLLFNLCYYIIEILQPYVSLLSVLLHFSHLAYQEIFPGSRRVQYNCLFEVT